MRCCDVEKLWDDMRDALQPHREAGHQASARVPAVPGTLRAVRRHRILPDVLAAARTAGDARAENHRSHPHRGEGDRPRQRREDALAARAAVRRLSRKRHHLRRARSRRRRRSGVPAHQSAPRPQRRSLDRTGLGRAIRSARSSAPTSPISRASTSATSRRSNKRRCAPRPRFRPAKCAATAGSPPRSASPTRRAPSAASWPAIRCRCSIRATASSTAKAACTTTSTASRSKPASSNSKAATATSAKPERAPRGRRGSCASRPGR